WPAEATFAKWRSRLPEGFLFTVKAPRGLTHSARLYGPEKWLATINRGLCALEDRLGILLVQLPPGFPYDYDPLAYVFAQVPAWIRVAVEFRHPSWNEESIFALLEQRQAAYCIMSGAGLPCLLRATAPFVYIRLHGPNTHHLYACSYSEDDLRWWRD